MQKGLNGTDRVVREWQSYEPISDNLLIVATDIEDQLMQGGAKPEKDYTILDCFKLAIEYMKTKEYTPIRNMK
jgi:hypothetical protein